MPNPITGEIHLPSFQPQTETQRAVTFGLDLAQAGVPARSGIYCFRNSVDGKIYVGKTEESLRRRRAHHVKELRTGRHNNPYFQNVWNKHGEQSFTFHVLQFCPREKCLSLEEKWIKKLKANNHAFGYNLCAKGTDQSGLKRSEESRKRMSEAGLSKPPMTKETRDKLAELWRGRKHSEAAKAKMSELAKKRPPTPDWVRKKISETLKRRGQTPEHRAKIAAAVGTPEARAKMSKAHEGVPLSPKHKRNLAKAIRSPEVRAKISASLKGNQNRIKNHGTH